MSKYMYKTLVFWSWLAAQQAKTKNKLLASCSILMLIAQLISPQDVNYLSPVNISH